MEIAERDGFVIDTDHERLDLPMICEFVAASYWGEGVAREDIALSVAQSRAFGLYGLPRAEGLAVPAVRLRGYLIEPNKQEMIRYYP